MTHPPGPRSGHIIVGIDGSEPSKQALAWAAEYAALVDSHVDAVITWQYPPSSGFGGLPMDWDPAADARRVLAETVTAVFGDNVPATLTQVVREGYAARILLDESEDAQMLVVGSRGHGGFAGLLLGSVSANCAEHAQCPVLVIHRKAQS
jgi:nucleotide-binding universal stress UspA family protein